MNAKAWMRTALVAVSAAGLLAAAAASAEAQAKKKKPRQGAAKPAPAAAPAPVDPARQAWAKAMGLSDAKRFDEALEVTREALRRFPDNTDLLWLEAGILGWSGRNAESVAHFERLMTNHPEMARALRRDLATQRLWAGDAAGAVRDFDLRLEEDPSDQEARRLRALALSHADRLTESLAAYDALLAERPGDLDLALDRARVIEWMGKHAQASAAYGEILRRHPGDARARLGVARNENLGGNHRRAAALFEEMLRDGEDDPEIEKGLAYAYYWGGRPDRSRTAIDSYLARRPDDREGAELAAMLARDNAPYLTTGFARSDDSDALRIRTTTVEYGFPVRGGVRLELHGRRDNVKDQDGNRDPLRVGAEVVKTWSDEWSGRASLYHYQPDDDEDGLALGGASLTYRPEDRVRLDAGFEREPVMSRIALATGIRVNSLTAGVEWQRTDRTSFRAAQRLSYYNDDNRSTLRSAGARAVAIVEPRTTIALTFEIQHLTTRLDLDNGYYDPERYLEFGPGVDVEWRPKERWTLGFEGQIGRQEEKGAEGEDFHKVLARLEMPVGQSMGLSVEAGQSNSNLSSPTGFKQNRWAAYLTTRL